MPWYSDDFSKIESHRYFRRLLPVRFGKFAGLLRSMLLAKTVRSWAELSCSLYTDLVRASLSLSVRLRLLPRAYFLWEAFSR